MTNFDWHDDSKDDEENDDEDDDAQTSSADIKAELLEMEFTRGFRRTLIKEKMDYMALWREYVMNHFDDTFNSIRSKIEANENEDQQTDDPVTDPKKSKQLIRTCSVPLPRVIRSHLPNRDNFLQSINKFSVHLIGIISKLSTLTYLNLLELQQTANT
ncbi:uncharacterized protein BYT42DRAFT_610709 [Radiomyces spectabilis]|uniref:uncharacterized protein n=1 Tax=Radiomyces spectabilis TaxID=64574 RepID=UPI0022206FB2|nr:uncharacterized protein BYT42DRAFT_610709 [Radiomyces spectabilis]KAI8391487.1 hypothetical protein BYT42DRAFT_610709 [Radiomyces spectabilis]